MLSVWNVAGGMREVGTHLAWDTQEISNRAEFRNISFGQELIE
jgi:hypothetical protein